MRKPRPLAVNNVALLAPTFSSVQFKGDQRELERKHRQGMKHTRWKNVEREMERKHRPGMKHTRWKNVEREVRCWNLLDLAQSSIGITRKNGLKKTGKDWKRLEKRDQTVRNAATAA